MMQVDGNDTDVSDKDDDDKSETDSDMETDSESKVRSQIVCSDGSKTILLNRLKYHFGNVFIYLQSNSNTLFLDSK